MTGTVVPKGDGTGLPREAACKFRSGLMREQKMQQRRAFLNGHAFEMRGVADIDVQQFFSGLGMRSDNRMHSFQNRV